MENKETTNNSPTVRDLLTQELKSSVIGTGKISNITIESDLGKKIIENIYVYLKSGESFLINISYNGFKKIME